MTSKIAELKKQKNAVILAHNYQLPEVQDVADFVGDSLGLSMEASKTNADIIIFCGVHFMAETAKILNPKKKVLMPDLKAGCPMANMITADQLVGLRKKHPAAKVVCYINTTATVKAHCDICCTSGNVLKVVGSLRDGEIIFIPDQYLGSWVSKRLNKQMVLWPGFCNIHVKILPEHITAKKRLYPNALVMVHPECTPAVIDLADKVASTSGMIDFPRTSPAKEFIVGTETGIIHRLNKKYPDRKFYPAYEGAICPNMKLTTLEKVMWCLEEEEDEVFVLADIAEKAGACIGRMLDL
ncbi:MAG: quinolinate synthase NadA [Candidatus Saganbacteria bacterium]|nr:quinolinate synthase NadA [Candidatus Saganbacteria bacterium]